MARKKKIVINETITRETAEEYFAAYAKADASMTKINADLDLRIAKLRESKQETLAKLQNEKEGLFLKLEHFANTNGDFFAKKKSLDLTHGKIGFRTGTPKLKTLRGFTWAAVTNMLKEVLPEYVKTKEEPNKEKILMDRSEISPSEMRKVGVEVVQDETFYVEPKKEETE